MSELPESVTLEWIGRTLIEMKGEIREVKSEIRDLKDRMSKLEDRMSKLEDRMSSLEDRMTKVEDRMTKVEDRFDRFEIETSDRFSNVEAAMFRSDAAWRGVQEACGEILHHLRAPQHH